MKNLRRLSGNLLERGNINIDRKALGRNCSIAFIRRNDTAYPDMLELFSRKPDAIKLANDSHLTPIPVDDEISSLSAILLDDDYYQFIHAGKCEIEGLSVVAPGYIIPLKARAWLDLSERSNIGSNVDSGDIRKHKNDVIRLYQLLSAGSRIVLPQSIRTDMQKFLNCIKNSAPINLKELGIKNINFDDVIKNIAQIYDL